MGRLYYEGRGLILFWSQRQMHEENGRHFETIETRIGIIENILHGNGKDGLVVIVAQIRQTQQFHQKIAFVMLVAVVSTAINNFWPIVVRLFLLATK